MKKWENFFSVTVAAVFFITFMGGSIVSSAFAAKTDKIVFAAGRPDDAWFALSHGLAGMINERSEWGGSCRHSRHRRRHPPCPARSRETQEPYRHHHDARHGIVGHP